MRYMALAENGHTRAIPNGLARALPLHLVWLDDGPFVAKAAGRFYRDLVGGRLLRIGRRDADTIHAAFRSYLAGTSQCRKVVGATRLPENGVRIS